MANGCYYKTLILDLRTLLRYVKDLYTHGRWMTENAKPHIFLEEERCLLGPLMCMCANLVDFIYNVKVHKF